MKTTSTSLVKQAMMAILLTIGFYGLALLIVVILLFIPYFTVQHMRVVSLQLILFCLITAGVILWSIWPRIDHFEPPGLLIKPAQFPKLFKQIEGIAQKTDQKMPLEVYLVPDMNAYVAERGGILGIGSKRIMGIGLPLLQYLTVSQLRAVLAHEFGHYYSKDTKAGIWVYKIRSTIIRTVLGLGENSWVKKPFIWYANMFLRITNAVSRNQEFVADELAARTEGAQNLIESLKTIHKLGPAFEAFWVNEYGPVIEAGYYPPLSEGFVRFIENPEITQKLEELIASELKKKVADPYDTHPSLTERVKALQQLSSSDMEKTNGDLAVSLIGDNEVSDLEKKILVELWQGKYAILPLKTIEWKAITETIHIPNWKRGVSNFSEFLAGVTFATLPQFIKSPDKLSNQLKEATEGQITQQEIDSFALDLAGSAVAIVLAKQGWQFDDFFPGAEITLRHTDMIVKPFTMLYEIKSGKRSLDSWQALCEQVDVAHVELNLVLSSILESQ